MEKNQETLKEIEKKRKELGLSQVELAKRIGFSRGYYNMLVHGKSRSVTNWLTSCKTCFRNTGKKKKAVMEHGQKIRRTVLEQRMTYGTPEKQERWQTST